VIRLRPVTYVAPDLDTVRKFETSYPKLSSYWTDAECTAIKSTIKQHYLAVQRHTCCYCRQIIAISHGRVWDAEHIVPRKSHPGFMFTPQNLALACPDCNGAKSAKQTLVDPSITTYPNTGDAFLVVHPHFDKYADHIEQGEYLYVRRSDKGQWTITNCNLGRFAGQQFGWPEPIEDDRFENLVDDVFDGGAASARVIGEQLRSRIHNAHFTPEDTVATGPV
jgi:hypothetical protein